MNLDEHLRDKEATHGPFEDTATIAQTLKEVMRRGRNWPNLPSASKEALDNCATLIARILNGDAADPKHWNGAAGYLRLRSNALSGQIVESGISQITRRLRPSMPPVVRIEDKDGVA
jgi:hypothetical protein